MKTSARGLDLIKAHEGLRLEAYPDPASGGDPWTIGYGHTAGVKPGDVITQEQADAYLREDIAWAEDAVRSGVKVPISQAAFDAMVSLTFNIGAGAFGRSTLLKMLNAGDHAGAADQFMRWTTAAGRVMPGLEKRRAAERALFLSEQAPAPIETRTIPKEKQMTPFIAAALPSIIEAIPKLGRLFSSGSKSAERNLAAAEAVVSIVQEATGAANAQQAVEMVQRDPVARQAAAEAVERRWMELTEAGGGGIAGAREAVKTAPGPSKNPVLWVSAALLPLVYMVVAAVLFRDGWSDEVRAMVVAAVVTGALGAVTSYWLGTSISSAKKDDALMGR
jgi:lysozyme